MYLRDLSPRYMLLLRKSTCKYTNTIVVLSFYFFSVSFFLFKWSVSLYGFAIGFTRFYRHSKTLKSAASKLPVYCQLEKDTTATAVDISMARSVNLAKPTTCASVKLSYWLSLVRSYSREPRMYMREESDNLIAWSLLQIISSLLIVSYAVHRYKFLVWRRRRSPFRC